MSTTRAARQPADRKAPAKRTPAAKPKPYTLEDDVLVWTSKSGAKIRIDLDIPADILAGSLADDPDDDPDDETQLQGVLGWVGQEAVDAFESMGILERTRFTAAFFHEFTLAVALARGEFVSSLPSAGSTAPNSDSTSAGSSGSPSTPSA